MYLHITLYPPFYHRYTYIFIFKTFYCSFRHLFFIFLQFCWFKSNQQINISCFVIFLPPTIKCKFREEINLNYNRLYMDSIRFDSIPKMENMKKKIIKYFKRLELLKQWIVQILKDKVNFQISMMSNLLYRGFELIKNMFN